MKHVTFIINGEDVPVDYCPWTRLATLRDLALDDSYNTGRPHDHWEIRDARGVYMDAAVPMDKYDLPDGQRLFLCLRVGAGGITRMAA